VDGWMARKKGRGKERRGGGGNVRLEWSVTESEERRASVAAATHSATTIPLA
jgi:hypothetical protein